jgi:hypothetical protein
MYNKLDQTKYNEGKTKMKVLFYLFGILLYSLISTAVKSSGYILGGIPTMVLFLVTVVLVPFGLNKRRAQRIINKKSKKLSAELQISEDIPAYCESLEDNDRLTSYLQTCVDKGLLSQSQSDTLFAAYKQK